jgi:hypothetical protein
VAGQFAISFRMHDFFFDRRFVADRMRRANRQALSKAGAFIRTRARTSLRRRKKSSPPGRPPSVHSTDGVATLKNILFAYEPHGQSLVVGPVALNQVNQSWIDMRSRTVPQVLEFGDVLTVHEWRFAEPENKQKWAGWDKYTSSAKFSSEWRRRDRRWRNVARRRRRHTLSDLGVQTRSRRAIYRPRPFMGPALEAEKDHIPDAWVGSLGG